MPVIAVPAAFGLSAALTSAIVTGVVYGAVIGAGVALATGGNVLKGALTGAAIGGVTGGILSGFSSAAAAGTTTAPAATSVSLSPVAVDAAAAIGEPGLATAASQSLSQQGAVTGAGTQIGSQVGSEVVKKGMSTQASNIYGGLLEGFGGGIGAVGAAKMESDTAKDIAETERKYEINRTNRNVPGVVPGTTMNITLPERWKNLIDVSATLNKYKEPLNQGLLQQKVT